MENSFDIQYVRINKENEKDCTEFLKLGYEYIKEVASEVSFEINNKFINSMVNLQNKNSNERWLIGLKVHGNMVGFAHFKIDQSEYIGWGYILEFYIKPDFRRKGLGSKLYNFIKEKFTTCGIKDIWLTANRINGEPFWFSLGFLDSGKIENEMKVLEIEI